jgi:AraC family transcriptional regulator, arabinose operon regulatory protein
MEDFSKIIESLYVRLVHTNQLEIVKSVHVKDYYDLHNVLVLVNKGSVTFGKDNEEVNEGEILFIPSGKVVSVRYGSRQGQTISKEELNTSFGTYFKNDNINPTAENLVVIKFEAKVFESVNFFQSTDIPAFKISGEHLLISGIRELANEAISNFPGKDRMIKVNTDRLVVNIIRHILKNQIFTEQLATNINYFKDPRLLDIFSYIKNNLSGDLSNRTLSNVANVSEDYVGQYFKMLTGINPQDYIEYQRMERAVELLRTTKTSVNNIAEDLGYKDTAYFCRRFKMMFGISAGKMRKRETTTTF